MNFYDFHEIAISFVSKRLGFSSDLQNRLVLQIEDIYVFAKY